MLSRSPLCKQHNRFNHLWLTFHDPLPVRVCDMVHLIEEMSIKALYNHKIVASISKPGFGHCTDQNGVSYTWTSLDCDT